MVSRETRTKEEERTQLESAEEKVVSSMKEMLKAGASDEKKSESFKKSAGEFENLVKISIVKEGGLNINTVADIVDSLSARLKSSHKSLKNSADEARESSNFFTPMRKLSANNLDKLDQSVLEVMIDLERLDFRVSNAMIRNAADMEEFFAKKGISPTELPSDGAVREK